MIINDYFTHSHTQIRMCLVSGYTSCDVFFIGKGKLCEIKFFIYWEGILSSVLTGVTFWSESGSADMYF
jgi:hypothetical protein